MESKSSPSIGEALYWFNWQKISDAGEGFYGAYVYRSILKFINPGNMANKIRCMIMDGDFFSSTKLDPRISVTDSVMVEVTRQGVDDMYVIAIKGDEKFDYAQLDSYLKKTGVIGYIGMLKIPQMDYKEFYDMGNSMALIFSIEIDEGYMKKVDFGFIGNKALEEMGFILV